MRDPNRLNKFYEGVCEIHKRTFADWRFGQFMCNFLGWYGSRYGDPFFPEESKMLEAIKEYENYIKGGCKDD